MKIKANIRKKMLLILIILIISFQILIPKNGLAYELTGSDNIRLGDVNLDNRIDSADVLLVLRHIYSQNNNKHSEWILNDEKFKVADITKDNKIDLGDILIILRYMAAKNDENIRKKHPDWLKRLDFESEVEIKKQIEVTEIKIDKNEINLNVGQSIQLKATVLPENATDKTLIWKVSDTSVATVNEGMIKAKKAGKTIITAKTSNGKYAEVEVTVSEIKPEPINIANLSVELSKNEVTYNGKEQKPSVTVRNKNVTLKEGTDYTVEYINNKNIGIASVKIIGKGKYTGNIIKEFKINKIIYDIVLFVGQSNMVGYARDTVEKRYNHNNYNYNGAKSIQDYSAMTKIDKNILNNNGKTLDFVSIKQADGTAYEYIYLTNSFRKIDSTKKMNYGENLVYKNGKLLDFSKTDKKYVSNVQSKGTNMIPQFCQTYYKLTGHKVIAVFAANPGRPIESFLPQNDSRNKKYKLYIYEALKMKYNSAVKLAKSKNLNIGNKLYVIAQGESDVSLKTTTEQYKKIYKSIHNSFKKDLGIEKGAIVETASTTGTRTMKQINAVHQAQEELIKENKDIVLGSSYFYDRFVSTESDYKNCNTKVTIGSDGKKLSYKEALIRSRYSTDPTLIDKSTGKRNYIHFTSAALSQVGMDVAKSLSKIIK